MRGRHRGADDDPHLVEVRVQVAALAERINTVAASLGERIDGNRAITEEQFVRYGTMLKGEAEKTALALASSDKAITKAEVATERRFESVNEFRAQLADLIAKFINRDQYDASHKPLVDRIGELVAERATLVRREFLDQVIAAQQRDADTARVADQARLEQLGKDVRELQRSGANMQGRFWALGVAVTGVVTVVVIAVNVIMQLIG